MKFSIDRTPEHLRCTFTASCPSVHELEDGRLLIVGTLAAPIADLHGVSWEDGEEYPIVIDRALLGDLFQTQLEDTRCGHQETDYEAKAREIIYELTVLGQPGYREKACRLVAAAISEAVAKATEECALVAEYWPALDDASWEDACEKIAAAIRNRGAQVTEPISQGPFEPDIKQQISDTMKQVIDGLITMKEGRRKIHTLKALLEAQGRALAPWATSQPENELQPSVIDTANAE